MTTEPLTWARAIEMHAKALGLDTSLIPLLLHKRSGEMLVRFCRGDAAELARVLAVYTRDKWVARERPALTHFVKHYAKYHLQVHEVSTEDAAERARKRREAIQDAQMTVNHSDNPAAVARARETLKRLGAA